MVTVWMDEITQCLKDSTTGDIVETEVLRNTAAPILSSQIPTVKMDLTGMIKYAHDKGVKVCDLSEDEKNMFITDDTVESLQKKLQATIKYQNVIEWNLAREAVRT